MRWFLSAIPGVLAVLLLFGFLNWAVRPKALPEVEGETLQVDGVSLVQPREQPPEPPPEDLQPPLPDAPTEPPPDAPPELARPELPSLAPPPAAAAAAALAALPLDASAVVLNTGINTKGLVPAAVAPVGTGTALQGPASGAGTGTGTGVGQGTGLLGGGGRGAFAGFGSRQAPAGGYAKGEGFKGKPLVPLSTARPQMPEWACQQKIKGWVEVVFVVMPSGRVQDVKIIDANPRGVYEAAAIESVSHWIYAASKSAQEVKQRVPMDPEDCAYNYTVG